MSEGHGNTNSQIKEFLILSNFFSNLGNVRKEYDSNESSKCLVVRVYTMHNGCFNFLLVSRNTEKEVPPVLF